MIVTAPGLHQRQRLAANWQTCSMAAGTSQPDAAGWVALPELMPVGAAMQLQKSGSSPCSALQLDSRDWWYRLRFDAARTPSQQRALLGFDGLATVAKVWLNGILLLESANMFIAHECDVSAALLPNDNELLILFSAHETQLARRRSRPRWRVPMLAHQQLRWLRTTLLGRCPGWSPPGAIVGPWKDVWLEYRDAIEIRNLNLELAVEGGAGLVTCSLELAGAGHAPIDEVWLELKRNGQVYTQLLARAPGSAAHAGNLRVPDVDLWWPHTHGTPSLYELAVSVRRRCGATSAVALGRVGFRTITLDDSKDHFSLAINGASVFCRGACWTPLNPATLRSTLEECRTAVAQAQAAGMNMLRVTGTTVYEEDHFYAACDEYGMLVWQDFMFANMDYPFEDAEFSASVEQEVRQQLNRLQACACLAVYCGNSEVGQQASMWGAPAELWKPAFFDRTLARLCAGLAPRTPYWPSSAHGGSFPHQVNAGSASYYGVGAYLRPLEDARRAGVRFATECLAFANVPSPAAHERMPGGLATKVHHAAWKERSPRDLGAGWDFDDVRDHYLELIFRTDPQKLRQVDHAHYLTLSRMASGEVMAATFAEWRLPASSCRGALVLFLRDFWAGAGWGLLDETGAPKACYHYLKRVLQPVTVLLSDEGLNGLFIHVLNERAEDRQLKIELGAWRGGGVQLASGKRCLNVPARGARSFSCLDLIGHFADLNYAYRFGPLPCDVVAVTLRDAEGTQLARAFHFPGGLSATRVEDGFGLTAQAIRTGPKSAQLTVRTERFAQGIHFDIPGLQADDEYFHLPPDSEVRVTLHGDEKYFRGGLVCAGNSTKSVRIEWVNVEAASHGKGVCDDRQCP